MEAVIILCLLYFWEISPSDAKRHIPDVGRAQDVVILSGKIFSMGVGSS